MTRAPLLLLTLLLLAAPARAVWQPEGIDLARPRLLFRAGDEPAIQVRLAREPWRTVGLRMWDRIADAKQVALDDHLIDSERRKARATRNLAFFYAIDRAPVQTPQGLVFAPFPSAAERAAAGDQVRTWLVHMFDRSRLAAPPPLGDWDRDISTSEELLQYASAWDALLGAGYDAGADAAVIERNIAAVASELYDNYLNPETAQNRAPEHQNNHRLKSAASLVMASIAVAEYVPAPGDDPRGVRDPALWLAWGLREADLMFRHVLVTGDGAYAEGPFYQRYASQNWIPFARAWDRLVDGADWPALGVVVPSPWRHPLFARVQRWMLDMTLPDGSLAPFDDGNPGRAYYFGAAPGTPEERAAWMWRWEHAPPPWEIDGNVDLGADALVLGDDGLVPAPPSGSPTAFYVEGGNAAFRSDWSADAVYALALAEHDTAALFGRDREGQGVVPQSHEHMEPGAFLLHAFGEPLLLDPGYVSFPERSLVNQPQHHNTILVDGRGPQDFLGTSFFFWRTTGLDARPPTDGQASLAETLDTGFLDAATAAFRVGLRLPGPPTDDLPRIRRGFLFPDHRYLVLLDAVTTKPGLGRSYTWLLHGNGGGTSGGTFARTPDGARWSRAAARVDAGIAFADVAPSFEEGETFHEAAYRQVLTHTVLKATASGDDVRSVALLYPSRSGDAPPAIARVPRAGVAALRLDDAAGDRRVLVAQRERAAEAGAGQAAEADGGPAAATTAGELAFSAAESGLGAGVATDGQSLLVDEHADGRLRLAFAEDATRLRHGAVTVLETASRGRLGLAPAEDRVEGLAETSDEEVLVRGLGFAPLAGDGVCGIRVDAGGTWLRLSRERRFVLRAQGGNSAPAADPGVPVTVSPGDAVALDGTGSCDLDGDALTARWELVSAPAGSAWRLEHADTFHPVLHADRTGPFRVQLVVRDARGAESRPAELLVLSGARCSDGVDNDLDGLFDHPEDPGCAHPQWPTESPRCSNGRDDDGDGETDFPADPECLGAHSLREDVVTCGLGFELAAVLPLLAALRRLRGTGLQRPRVTALSRLRATSRRSRSARG